MVSTHTPLARHDLSQASAIFAGALVSTHMPLARHDFLHHKSPYLVTGFYSHASCEA